MKKNKRRKELPKFIDEKGNIRFRFRKTTLPFYGIRIIDEKKIFNIRDASF